MVGPADLLGEAGGEHLLRRVDGQVLEPQQEGAGAAALADIGQGEHHAGRLPCREGLGLGGGGLRRRGAGDAGGEGLAVLPQRYGRELAVEGEGEFGGGPVAVPGPGAGALRLRRAALPIGAAGAGDDAAAVLAEPGEVAFGGRRVAQEAERNEAGEEFGILPRLPGRGDAMPGGNVIGGARLAEAQQLAGQDLAFRPGGAGGIGGGEGDQPGAGGEGGGGLLVLVAAAQPAGAFQGQPGIGGRGGGHAGGVGIRPVGGIGEPGGGIALPRRVEIGHRPGGGGGFAGQRQPVEAAGMLGRGQAGGVAGEVGGLGHRVGRRLGPAGAEHLGRLGGAAGTGEGIGEALVAVEAARSAGGEPLGGEAVVGVEGQGLLDAGGPAYPGPAIPGCRGRSRSAPPRRRPGRAAAGAAR